MSPAVAQPYSPVAPAGPVPAAPPVAPAAGSAAAGSAGGPTKGPAFPERFRFSVDLYESMTASGILGENDKVELIEGEILTKMPIGDPQIGTVRWLNRFFQRTSGDRVVVSVQDPIRLADSEPEPDVALLRPRADFYRSGKAGAADTLLVIEVADTSEAFDRDVKGPMYARGGGRRVLARLPGLGDRRGPPRARRRRNLAGDADARPRRHAGRRGPAGRLAADCRDPPRRSPVHLIPQQGNSTPCARTSSPPSRRPRPSRPPRPGR